MLPSSRAQIARHLQGHQLIVTNTVTKAKPLKDNESRHPLKVEEGGLQAPFSCNSFVAAMTKGAEHVRGCNLFWLRLTFLCLANIPTDMSKVKRLTHHYFKSPDCRETDHYFRANT